MAWFEVGQVPDGDMKRVVRVGGRQILLIRQGGALHAVDNRCPHEGYPLSEGTLSADGCVLTCQWHNWKFDLASGDTLIGGDRLRQYPVRAGAGGLAVEITEPPLAEQRAQILYALEQACEDNDYGRIAREIARLRRLPGEVAAVLGRAIRWAAPRLEDGMGHGFAGAVDWLALADGASEALHQVAALAEAVGHIADEARSVRLFPYAEARRDWSAPEFLSAMEAQEEAAAIALVRGALAEGVAPDVLRPVFAEAALRHYQDFGHSAIYVVASFRLLPRLEQPAGGALLLSLTRSLIRARREDLIPEFRAYGPALTGWGQGGAEAEPLIAENLHRLPLAALLRRVTGWSAAHPPQAIFAVLLAAAARSLASFDPDRDQRIRVKPADNVGWLDFTHALTFADAGRTLAVDQPGLWPAVLLQLACFIGRNQPYLLPADPPLVSRPALDPADILDHQQGRFIHSVHRLKTWEAARRLADAVPPAGETILAAVQHYLAAPVKPRHPLRVAHQALELVG